jgi:hypothetical protein
MGVQSASAAAQERAVGNLDDSMGHFSTKVPSLLASIAGVEPKKRPGYT